MMQRALDLVGGWHIGPLFVPRKKRLAKPRMQSTHRDRLVRQRTPKWADRKAICKVYVEALRKKVETGVQHSVDHIVPLNHPLVCGLHVDNNLRVLPLEENMRRSNNGWWPDAPFEQGELYE